tara:strand:+ start:12564 stop:13013 length:450 start_codon:yes stop_codon:yes gene_type:complete
MSQSRPTDIQINAYAENYVLYGDQSRAWRIAFPESKSKPENIHTKASLMHSNAKVQQRIEEIRSKLINQSEEEFLITVSDLKKMLLEAAHGGLKEKVDAQENKILHNIAGAVSAISEINRMDGNHAPVKQQVYNSETSPWAEIKASIDK